VRAETNAASVSVIDSIDAATYEAKVAQFDAEIGTMGRLRPRAETLSRAVDRLQTARQQDANNSDSAAETASRAADELESAEESLRTVLDEMGDDAASLRPITTRLVEVAATKARAAREIAGEATATPTPTSTSSE
jgi:DNA repair ATPase RecN